VGLRPSRVVISAERSAPGSRSGCSGRVTPSQQPSLKGPSMVDSSAPITDPSQLASDAWEYCITPLLPVDEIHSHGLNLYQFGEGVRLTDYAGKVYLDMMSSHTRANSLGYGNTEIANAVAEQLSRLHYVGTVY